MIILNLLNYFLIIMRAPLTAIELTHADEIQKCMNQSNEFMIRSLNQYLEDRSFLLAHKGLFCYIFNELIENHYFIPGDLGLIIQNDRQTFVPVAEGFMELNPEPGEEPLIMSSFPFIGWLLSKFEEGASIQLLQEPQ